MKKEILYIILTILISINICIVLLLVNKSNLLSSLTLDLVWVISILIGMLTFVISRKCRVDSKFDVAILCVTIFSIINLLFTGVILRIILKIH